MVYKFLYYTKIKWMNDLNKVGSCKIRLINTKWIIIICIKIYCTKHIKIKWFMSQSANSNQRNNALIN